MIFGGGRRFLAPEVVQTSAMDCGPTALTCLLNGYGIPVSFARLREACQTDVDGTSIETLEEVAGQLGLEAEQIMLPPDHLVEPEAEALPAIVVIRIPGGLPHFVVAWRRIGGLVQLMDPATGRRWESRKSLEAELFIHTMPFLAEGWRDWAGSDASLAVLRRRLARLGLGGGKIDRLIESAESDERWRSLAALEAAARMSRTLVHSGALARGREVTAAVETLFEHNRVDGTDSGAIIPDPYWTARQGPPDEDGDEQILLRGAVLVRIRGRCGEQPNAKDDEEEAEEPAGISEDLAAALEEPPVRPARTLLGLLREDGLLAPSLVVWGLAIAAFGVLFEAVLFRGFFDLAEKLGMAEQRIGGVGALIAFILILLCIELASASSLFRLGRHLECRLRYAFMKKIPRLGDRYFQSRLISDLAQRTHNVHTLRRIPLLGGNLIRSVFGLLFTAAGIVWLDPESAPLAALAAGLAVGLPTLAQPVFVERDLKVRTHLGGLSRFYLDAIIGLIPVRTHGAERTVRREHEELTTQWVEASLHLQRSVVTIEGLQALTGYLLAAWLLHAHLARVEEAGTAGAVLLIVYWALNLPVYGQEIALAARQYPLLRNNTLRFLEPLGAPEDERAESLAADQETVGAAGVSEGAGGVTIEMTGVSVRATGNLILRDVDLTIEAGSHVGIVGPSGAGKSTLQAVLFGWHRLASGTVLIDGVPLEKCIRRLHQVTAWVDPDVHLWNRTLLENLQYGAPHGIQLPLAAAVQESDLQGVLEKMPDGYQTPLGEGGGLVSGGEGQRVRLGRAMLRQGVRMALLDEPFRGLDRNKRRKLLARTREWWKDATILCVSHDVGDTATFDRVLVIEGGAIVEDGPPAELAAIPDSRYNALIAAEDAVREGLWSSDEWRRLWLDRGKVAHEDGRVSDEAGAGSNGGRTS